MSDGWARSAALSTESLEALLDNRIAAIAIPGFATRDECQAFAVALSDVPLQYYKVGRPAGYVGMTFIQYMRKGKEEYFENVASAAENVRRVTSRSFDPVERFIRRLGEGTNFSVSVAHEPGYGQYFAGIIRILSGGNDIHIDFAPQFAKDHVVGRIAAQLTWNVYVDDAASGGETTIWNRPWMPTGDPEQDSRYPHFTREELAGAEAFAFKARAGDVMIFNSRNPHQVEVTGRSETLNRIGLGSFMGRAGARELILWS